MIIESDYDYDCSQKMLITIMTTIPWLQYHDYNYYDYDYINVFPL